MDRKNESSNQTSLNGKTLIVYYSMSGNTHHVAEQLSQRLGSEVDVLRIKSYRAGFEHCRNPGEYNLVIIGTPVHGLNVSWPIKEYLKQNKGRFNNVAVFATCHLYAVGVLGKMSQLCGKTPIASAIFKSGNIGNNQITEELDSFSEEIQGRCMVAVSR